MAADAEFLALFLPHQREIKAYVSAAVRDIHAQNDIVQETALTLWRTFDRYDKARPFVSWARGVARNVVLQHYRKAGRNPVLIEPAALESLLNAFDETQPNDSELYLDALRHCMNKVPEKSRHLLELRYRTSLSIAEVADRLQSNVNAVNQALIRIRAALRACMDQQIHKLNREGVGWL